jgi:hypothetical protein
MYVVGLFCRAVKPIRAEIAGSVCVITGSVCVWVQLRLSGSKIREKNACYCAPVPVNSTHSEYDATASAWSRARDVLAGEDAVKAGRERYLPRLDSQTDDEYTAYQARASFFNATSRTAEGYSGLIFRRPPFVKIPKALVLVWRWASSSMMRTCSGLLFSVTPRMP